MLEDEELNTYVKLTIINISLILQTSLRLNDLVQETQLTEIASIFLNNQN